MIKTITFLKRRADMTREEFVTAYESGHAKLGEQTLTGNATRYVRRYLIPIDHPLNEEGKDGPAAIFDAVMEMWFKDREQFNTTMDLIGSPELAKEIIASGHDIFDRSVHYVYEIDERESDITPASEAA